LATNSKDNREAHKSNNGNKLISTTWGTLLLILSLTVVSVCIYAPIKANAFHPDKFALEQSFLLILAIGGVTILMTTILALAIPYSAQKLATIIKLFNSMFLEFKGFLWLIFFLTFIFILSNIPGFSYNYPNDFTYETILLEANWYFYLIGLPLSFLLLSLIYLSICYLKHIYYTGLREGLIKNSLAGRIFLYTIASIKNSVDKLVAIDLTKDYNKRLLALVGFNFIALFVIASTGPLGALLAVAYTVLLFNYAVKVLEKARELYCASSQLAQGNFAVAIPEDMGILGPFAKSLGNIKEGFKVAVEEEVKSQNMKTQLISNVSHDLKTPLTSIITYVDLLKDENLDREKHEKYVNILDQKSKRLQVLIEDLFEASKASSGNIELHWEELDVVALLRQTLGEMAEKIKTSTLQMRLNLPENKVICKLDGARTYRVFENIIGNILKYSLPQTRVYIDVTEDETKVSLTFKNISAYEMNFNPAEMTERFTRGDASRTTEGSGLGLAIAKSLVELQEGSLHIDIDGDLFKLTVTFPTVKKE
jgi:signal transduction histidine kinase